MSAAAVRAAFALQAGWCDRLGSPFTAALCCALAETLSETTETGRCVLAWPGDPFADALPIRLAGGLHALVRSGKAPELARLYPPAALDEAALAKALPAIIAEHDAALLPWILSAPQTNEVARSGVLMAGLLAVAEAARLPLRLFEIGASAGLNLRLDRYAYRLGALRIGPPEAPILLAPDWRGASPPGAAIEVVSRRGADLSPIDVTDAAARGRLLAYVWPDQPQRLERLERALAAAAADPPQIDRADAADWTERHVAPESGAATVLFHSIALQYFPEAAQRRIAAHMAAAGGKADASAPLAWLRYELDDPAAGAAPTLRLRMWPGGEDRLLARAHPHGASVRWLE